MGAPKKPNIGPAVAVRVRQGDVTAATRLIKSGWIVIPPEHAQSCAHTTPACGDCLAAALSSLEQS